VNDFVLPTLWLALGATTLAAVVFWRAAVLSPSGTQQRNPSWLPFLRPFVSASSDGAGLARVAATVGALLMVVALLMRWQVTDRPPYTNMWEFSVAFSASIAVFYVALDRRLRAAPIVGGVIQGVVALLLLATLLFFSSRVDPLVPALQSEGILMIHVGFMVASYGALSFSFGTAAVRLVQGDARRFKALPTAAVLDRLSHASVVVGFPLLTLGVLLGAYWANDAWGRYWAWDPKETASLVTWLIYGAYLHIHSLGKWRGTRASVLLVAGYSSVMFTYFGVNLWISGLHSYA